MVCKICGSNIETLDGRCLKCQNIDNNNFYQYSTNIQGQISNQWGQNNNKLNNDMPITNNQPIDGSVQMNGQLNNGMSITNNQPIDGSVQMNGQLNVNGTFSNSGQTKKSSKKSWLLIILIIILIFVGLFCIKFLKSDSNFGGGDFDIASGKRTMMIYIIGSDLESDYGAATSDINEMLGANFNTDYVNVIVYAGGAKKWHNDSFNSNENAIYEINGNNIEKLQFYGIEPMTESSTLTNFINYVYANYKTDLYDLILWDHGGGPVFGYGSDENDDASNFMSLLDIDKAINDSNLMKETKFEFIGFDACLMSSIEIAKMFKEEADYLIASSEVEPGQGWDYGFLSEINSKMNTEELGKSIIDYYYDYYQQLSTEYKNYYGYDYEPSITLSLINLRNIDSLVKSIDDLFLKVDSSINVSTYSKITRGVGRATMYGYQENQSIQFDLIDLYGLISELDDYATNVSLVQKELDTSIVYHKSTIDECYGMSMYFPITTRMYYSNIVEKYDYDDIVISENYANFLKKYVSIATGDRIVKSDMTNIVPDIVDNGISATLPSDIANNYQTADYILFRKVDDGSLLPVYKSKDVSIENNVIRATVSNRMISVSDPNGEDVYDIIAVESYRDKNSVTYSLIGILQYWDDDDFLGTFKSEVVEMYLQVDNKTNEGKIIDIKPSVSEDKMGTVPKVTYNLNDWKIMQFVSSSYFLYDEDNNKLSDWQQTDTMYGTEITIADGFRFFASELDKNNEYYYMFRVRDTQGNLYESDLVAAK